MRIKRIINYRPLDIFIKAVAGFFLVMVIALLLLSLIIRIPAVQSKLKSETASVLQKQLNSDVTIGGFRLGFPKRLVVSNILISEKSDTLLFVGEFSVNIKLFPLIRKKIIAGSIELKNTMGDIGSLMSRIPADTSDADPRNSGSGSWEFIAEKLFVESSYIKYRDDEMTYELILDIGYATLKLGSFNFDTLISVKSVDLKNTKVSYESLINIEDTSYVEFADIRVDKALLENSEFTYIDTPGAFRFYAGGENVSVDDLLVDINNETVEISDGYSENTTCSVKYFTKTDDSDSLDMDWGQYLWRVVGDELLLDGLRFTLDYLWEPGAAGHFDNSHMDIYDLKGSLTGFVLDKDTLTVGIHNLSAKEKNGLVILKTDGDLIQDGPVFIANDLKIQTEKSEYLLNLKTTISPTNYNDINDKDISLQMEFGCGNWNDIDYFYPFIDSLDLLSDDFGNFGFNLQTDISGKPDDISLEKFVFSLLDSTQLVFDGKIKGLLSGDSAQMKFNVEKLMTTKSDVGQLLNELPGDSLWTIPQYVIVRGLMSSDDAGYGFTGDIESDIGEINVRELKVGSAEIPGFRTDLSANLKNLKSIADFKVDKAVFKMSGSFKGDNLYESDADINLFVDSLSYNCYTYRDLKLAGKIENGRFGAKFNSADSNFLVSVSSNGELSQDVQSIVIDVDVGKIDIAKINLFDEDLKLKGKGVFAISISGNKYYDAKAKVQSLDLCFSDTLYKMHPAEMSFLTGENTTVFKLSSFYYNLDFSAAAYISDVVNSLVNLPGYYLSSPGNDSVKFYLPEMSIAGELMYPEAFVRLFFPGLPSFDKLTVSGGYNAKNDKIGFVVTLPDVKYNSIIADTLLFSITGSSDKLNYKSVSGFRIEDLMSGKLEIEGVFDNSELISNLVYSDTYSDQYLNLTAKIDTAGNKTVIRIIPDSLIFSYDKWIMNPENRIVIGDTCISINDFILNSEGQQISIGTYPENNPQNIELKLKDFQLGSLEHLFDLDTIVAGVANADFKFSDIYDNLKIDGNLEISGFSVDEFDAGELNLSEFSFSDSLMKAKMIITGPKEDIVLSGSYLFDNEVSPLGINLDMKSFDISDLNYLLEDYINNAKGTLSGKISVTGSVDSPVVNGNVNFGNAGIGINSLNNYFTLGNESIAIKDNIVDFNKLSIVNKKGQSAKVTGTISFGSDKKIFNDLRVITDNMEIMNSTEKDSDLLFGLLKAQADIEIKGTPDNMKVNANVDIDKSTDVTYVFPDYLYVNDNSGVVSFRKYSYDTLAVKEIPEEGVFYTLNSFRDVKLKVDIENGARFKLFFDKGGSDFLDAAISGSANYTVIEGNTGISGMFNVEDGKLHYSIPLVTVEDFDIEPGSYFTMSNDIYNPHLNIIASAKVRASTNGLMSGYNKVMTFKVLLYMVGDLDNIKLSFDISTETDDAMVSARLAQLTERERNVNALNLLVRGAFVISIHSDGAGSTTMLDSQVDKFYTSQLNHLISDNVKFVDLRFDVQSFRDYNSSGGQVFRRNYYYNIGKSFIHDRVRINYQGSLGISTETNADQINSSFVQNELEVEVKITKDGTYRGVLFRKDRYEGLMEGEVLETGGGIRIKKSFYSLKDMFTRDEEKKEAKKKKAMEKKMKSE